MVNKVLKSFCIFLFCLFGLQSGYASDQAILKLEHSLEDRLTPLIRQYDPKASVLVHIQPKKLSQNIPLTPFDTESLLFENEFSRMEVESIRIQIYAKVGAIPDKLFLFIQEVGAKYGPKPSIRLRAMGGEDVGEGDYNSEGRSLASSDSFSVKFYRFFHSLDSSSLSMMVFGLLGVGLGLVLLFTLRSSGRRVTKTLQGGFRQISGAIGETAFTGNQGHSGEGASMSLVENSSRAAIAAAQVGRSSSAHFGEMSLEGLTALISDCYWCEYDSYASFIWKQISISQKSELVSCTPYLSEYITFVNSVPPQDLKMEQDPFYLNPLDLAHLDNLDLLKVVREKPGVYFHLSSMRQECLKLTAVERIQLVRQAKSQENVTLPNFLSMRNSPPRALEATTYFELNSIEEEEAVLAMDDLRLEDKERIPSLAFLVELDSEQIKQVLEEYTARDLASAWIGPEKVLSELARLIPEKKRNLILEYSGRMEARRENPVFKRLHFQSMELLREKIHPRDPHGDRMAA